MAMFPFSCSKLPETNRKVGQKSPKLTAKNALVCCLRCCPCGAYEKAHKPEVVSLPFIKQLRARHAKLSHPGMIECP